MVNKSKKLKNNLSRLSIPFGRMLISVAGIILAIKIVLELSGCSPLSLRLKLLGGELDLRKGECPLASPPK